MAMKVAGPEEVVREFPRVGKYRVRLVVNTRTKARALDVREYVSSQTFEGFTRRGIRVGTRGEADLLKALLATVVDEGLLPERAQGAPAAAGGEVAP